MESVVKAEELKAGQVLHVLKPFALPGAGRCGMYLIVCEVNEQSVWGYRVLRNGRDGNRAWGRRTIPFDRILSIVKQPEEAKERG